MSYDGRSGLTVTLNPANRNGGTHCRPRHSDVAALKPVETVPRKIGIVFAAVLSWHDAKKLGILPGNPEWASVPNIVRRMLGAWL